MIALMERVGNQEDIVTKGQRLARRTRTRS